VCFEAKSRHVSWSTIRKSLVDKAAGIPQVTGDLAYRAALSAKLAYSGAVHDHTRSAEALAPSAGRFQPGLDAL
jgi:hypothetical protein